MTDHFTPCAENASNRQQPSGVFVQAPSARDGVVSALRRSFGTTPKDMPDDMLGLLARLDKH